MTYITALDEYQITGEYRTVLDHLLKSLVKRMGTSIQRLLHVISVCLEAVQWCASYWLTSSMCWHTLTQPLEKAAGVQVCN